MNIALINASPKKAESASGILLDGLKGLFPTDCDTKIFGIHDPSMPETAIEELQRFDAWVFAFPLYVDAVPSHLLSAMRQIESNKAVDKDICVYAVVNLGFYDGQQARNALAVMENWCVKSRLKWGGGIGFGGGGALASMKNVPLGRGPKTSLGKVFSAFSEVILSSSSQENIYASIGLPKFLYKLVAEMGWRHMIKVHGGNKRDLNKKL
ncbi:MAG: NAD(P)H-dependent oxidoreductase [Clostridiales bacterium]|jgi:multimeric flavodoxin WrbA|nr:NAD(P)H-dependent oxidoreductase [Clostridiales bacterium]